MIALDTNILVYAHRGEMPQHAVALRVMAIPSLGVISGQPLADLQRQSLRIFMGGQPRCIRQAGRRLASANGEIRGTRV